MRRLKYCVFLLFVAGAVRGQDARLLHLNGFDNLQAQLLADTLGSNIHFGVSPMITTSLSEELVPDYLCSGNLGSWDLKPLATARFSYSSDATSVYGGGAYVRMNRNKLAFEVAYQYLSSNETFVDEFYGNQGVYSGLLGGKRANGRVEGSDVFAYLSYAPIDAFQIQVGVGEHHLGQGFRSNFISDGGSPYPYMRLNTTIWRLQLTNLFTQFSDYYPAEDRQGTKYGAFHYLSLNAGRRWTFSAFEGVVWEQRDSLYQRGYELNYLNPVIFYRPVEFSLGSPDNVMLGGEVAFKVSNEVKLYSQILLDEFLLSEMIGGTGWWGNKYAIQAGAKWLRPFGLENGMLRAEFNVSRPFTYSHNNNSQSLVHENQPLAHPSGANLKEWLMNGVYSAGAYKVELTTFFRMQGIDSDSIVYGGDPRRSYNDRASDYGHFIGQGVGQKTFVCRADVFRSLGKWEPLNIQATVQYRSTVTDGVGAQELYFGIGLRSLISRQSSQF